LTGCLSGCDRRVLLEVLRRYRPAILRDGEVGGLEAVDGLVIGIQHDHVLDDEGNVHLQVERAGAGGLGLRRQSLRVSRQDRKAQNGGQTERGTRQARTGNMRSDQ